MTYSTLARDLLDRFLRYVEIDTMSDPHVTDKKPTTSGQMELLHLLAEELAAFGLNDSILSAQGYLIANIPANLPLGRDAPAIGFMAHVDVADDVMGNGVKPRVIDAYDGSDIMLNDTYTLSVKDNPELAACVGETIITTDGTTLLGGDDKAGVAILMALAKLLTSDHAIEHPKVQLLFTTDEETGRGMDGFPVNLLTCRCCYTMDGGQRGAVESECFNAAQVTVVFTGIPFHLGQGRGRLVNSVTMAASFLSSLPRNESPEATDGRYGYYCAQEVYGSLERTTVVCQVRDFTQDGLAKRLDTLRLLASATEKLFVGGKVEVSVAILYQNMRDAIEKDQLVMEAVRQSAARLGITLHDQIIRGGTDGAYLAQLGIPSPNLYTGTYNMHSRFEWVLLSAMEEATLLAHEIVAFWEGVGT